MLTWCAGAGVAGWLTMFVFWAVFVGLALWAISRLIPAAPDATPSDHSQPIVREPQPDVRTGVGPADELPTSLVRAGVHGHTGTPVPTSPHSTRDDAGAGRRA